MRIVIPGVAGRRGFTPWCSVSRVNPRIAVNVQPPGWSNLRRGEEYRGRSVDFRSGLGVDFQSLGMLRLCCTFKPLICPGCVVLPTPRYDQIALYVQHLNMSGGFVPSPPGTPKHKMAIISTFYVRKRLIRANDSFEQTTQSRKRLICANDSFAQMTHSRKRFIRANGSFA